MIYENVEKLMGHRVDYSTNSYYKPTEKDLLEDYLKAVPDLTVNKQATEEQLQARMDSKDQEVQQLKEQINKMQKDLQDIKEFELKRLRDPNRIFGGLQRVIRQGERRLEIEFKN